jgi:hypothetical protein
LAKAGDAIAETIATDAMSLVMFVMIDSWEALPPRIAPITEMGKSPLHRNAQILYCAAEPVGGAAASYMHEFRAFLTACLCNAARCLFCRIAQI